MDDEYRQSRDATFAGSGTAAGTLADEHAQLLQEVRLRGAAVTDQADSDEWPTPALRRLLDYLYVEVLQQVADEEWRLFREWGCDPEQLTALRADHLRVREAVETLTNAAVQAEPPAPRHLSDLVGALLDTLSEHFEAEQTTLQGELKIPPPSTAALGSTPHEWYPLAEGPVIDMDALPGPSGTHVGMARLLRLRRGEQIELHATADPRPMLRRLAVTHPGGYGVTVLQQAPHRWRIEVLCRSAA
jgi:uncharacterized protein (DUF2249 family)